MGSPKLRISLRWFLILLLPGVLLANGKKLPSPGQSGTIGNDSVAMEKTADSLVAALRIRPGYVPILARLKQTPSRAVAIRLKKALAETGDGKVKVALAQALIVMGERDSVYLKVLMDWANPAVKADIPFPIKTEGECKGGKELPNPAFSEWSRKNLADSATAVLTAIMDHPDRVRTLASVGDPRSAKVLLEALNAKNPMIISFAAMGLALIGDPLYLDLVIEITRKSSPCERQAIAKALVFFEGPEAEAAAEKYLQPKEILDAYRSEKAKSGRKALFGF